jgi:hypothetical protein
LIGASKTKRTKERILAENRPQASAATLAAVMIGSFVVLLFAMPRDLNIFDEGIVLSDAIRVAHGEVLHRDFYSSYGPGQYYVVAALFRIFGENFLAARLYDLVVRAATLTMLFYIIRRQCSLLISLTFTAIGGLWMLGVGAYLYPIFPCMLLSLISSYLVTRVREGPAPSSGIVVAGVCTGLTALFRYDVGFFVLIAHFASISAITALSENHKTIVRRAMLTAAAYGTGTALVFVPAAVLFLVVSSIENFVADIVTYSTKYYALMRGLPFPGLHQILAAPWDAAVYLPLLAVGLAFFELIRHYVSRTGLTASRSRNGHAMVYLIVFGSTAAMLFLKGIVRVSALHMLMGILPALIVFAILANLWWRRGIAGRLAAAFAVFLVVSPAAAAAFRDLRASYRIENRSIAGWLALRAGLISHPADIDGCDSGPASGIAKLSPDYSHVANYLAAHGRPDERILVGLDRHDKIFINPVGLYFAAGRLPGTHWHQFDPGLQTRADIQAKMIGDLKRNQVRWVVRDASFDEMNEPNGSANSSGVTLLDRYLDANYRPIASSGKVTIWLVNGETPAAIHPEGKCEASPIHN